MPQSTISHLPWMLIEVQIHADFVGAAQWHKKKVILIFLKIISHLLFMVHIAKFFKRQTR